MMYENLNSDSILYYFFSKIIMINKEKYDLYNETNRLLYFYPFFHKKFIKLSLVFDPSMFPYESGRIPKSTTIQSK